MTYRLRSRLALAIGAATLIASLSAGSVLAGEITGNGKLKDVHGRSDCAFSGQEDLQFFQDEGTDQVPVENPIKGVPNHSQSWGQIPKEGRDFLTTLGFNPGIACNPTKSIGE